MEQFTYKPGETTVDDVIEHVFMRLNTDFLDTYLDVRDFCQVQDGTCDSGMVRMVVDKMFEYGVAQKWRGRLATSTEIEVTPKGIALHRGGMGWKWIIAAKKANADKVAEDLRLKQEREENEKKEERDIRKLEARSTAATWVGAFTGIGALLLSIYTLMAPANGSNFKELSAEVEALKLEIEHLKKIQKEKLSVPDTVGSSPGVATSRP